MGSVTEVLLIAVMLDAKDNVQYMFVKPQEAVANKKLLSFKMSEVQIRQFMLNGGAQFRNLALLNDVLVGVGGDIENYTQYKGNKRITPLAQVFVSQPDESSILTVEPSGIVHEYKASSLAIMADAVKPVLANAEYTVSDGKITVTSKQGAFEKSQPAKPPVPKKKVAKGTDVPTYSKDEVMTKNYDPERQSVLPMCKAELEDHLGVDKEAAALVGDDDIDMSGSVIAEKTQRNVEAGAASPSLVSSALETEDTRSLSDFTYSDACNPYSLSFRYSNDPDADPIQVPDWTYGPNQRLNPENPEEYAQALRNRNCLDKMMRALNTLSSWSPLFSTFLRAMKRIFTRRIPTMGVNIKEFVINPDFLSKLSEPELMFVLYHELHHVFLAHTVRRGARDFYLWNVACDAIVNASLAKDFGLSSTDLITPVRVNGVYTDIREVAAPHDVDENGNAVVSGIFAFTTDKERDDLLQKSVETYYEELINRNPDAPDDFKAAIQKAMKQFEMGNAQDQAKQSKEFADRAKEIAEDCRKLASHIDGAKDSPDKLSADNLGDSFDDISDIFNNDVQSCNDEAAGITPQKTKLNRADYHHIAGTSGNFANKANNIAHNLETSGNPSSDGSDVTQEAKNLTEKIKQFAEDVQKASTQPNQQQGGQQGQGQQGQSGQSGQQGQGQGGQQGQQGQDGQGGQNGSQSGQPGQNGSQSGLQGGQQGQNGSQGGQGGQNGSQGTQSVGAGPQGLGGPELGGMGICVRVKLDLGNGVKVPKNIVVDLDPSNGDSPDPFSSNPRLPIRGDQYGGVMPTEIDNVREKELRRLIEAAKHLTEQAYGNKGGSGRGTGSFGSLIKYNLALMDVPNVNWRTLLHDFLTTTFPEDRALSCPDRTFAWTGQIFPGPVRQDPNELKDLLVCIDVSGSVSEDEVREALSHVYQIFTKFKTEAWVIWWSTKVTGASLKITKKKDIFDIAKLMPSSDWGTDINNLIAWLNAHATGKGRIRKVKNEADRIFDPCAILIITDGDIGDSKSIPEVKGRIEGKCRKDRVIWLITRESNYLTFEPPYGVKALFKI